MFWAGYIQDLFIRLRQWRGAQGRRFLELNDNAHKSLQPAAYGKQVKESKTKKIERKKNQFVLSRSRLPVRNFLFLSRDYPVMDYICRYFFYIMRSE